MSAIAGPYGSRKSSAQSFPRLTGKSIPLIGNQLLSYDREIPTNEDGVFLTGFLFCNLWKDNSEGIIGQEWYDPIFAGVRDDPAECVKMYLRKYNIDESRMEQIIESTLKQGYISYDPIPYIGKIHINAIGNGNLFDIVSDQHQKNVDQYFGKAHDGYNDDTKIGEILSNMIDMDHPDDHGFSWDELIMTFSYNKYLSLSEVDFDHEVYGEESRFFNSIIDATSNDLEETVRNMILGEKIIIDNKIIGTVKLSPD